MKTFSGLSLVLVLVLGLGVEAGEFVRQRTEFAKCHLAITGREAATNAVVFAIDPQVSAKGRDAFAVKSEGAGVKITGANERSLWYGLYDLLEKRGGCRWFWDGDVVPKAEKLDLTNLDYRDEAHFEYRAIRYFAHRGLTRFQAEHWGLDDWKREIDWCLKRKLNVFMLRIGQDDLFQRTFPETCAYPDPAQPLPGHGRGYDDRSLFWSLQFRGRLRQQLQQYGRERGLMIPEDFGTMTHWYSRTPEDFLDKRKPSFIPNIGGYGERNGLVWDVRDGNQWVDAYWKMTQTAVEAYGEGVANQQLLHTIGLGERHVFRDRQANFDLKVKALRTFLDRAHRDYPQAKVLIAGWDFYLTWKTDEVRKFWPTLDPAHDIIWDYEGDQNPADRHSNFTEWDVIGKFPYTYSMFLAYEAALDVRADYDTIEKRMQMVHEDPMCKGFILWPESSHTDILALRYFTANAWTKTTLAHGEVLDEFCASRYGKLAPDLKPLWQLVIPMGKLRRWENRNYGWIFTTGDGFLPGGWNHPQHAARLAEWQAADRAAAKVFQGLAKLPWQDEFVKRDAIDLARTALDRSIAARTYALCHDLPEWRQGRRKGNDLAARAANIAALVEKMSDVLALHTDYSLWESLQRLNAVQPVKNPRFDRTLLDNASCRYCQSHQYELARHWYEPAAKEMAAAIARDVAKGPCKATRAYTPGEKRRQQLLEQGLEPLRPTLPRTESNYRRVMSEIADLLQFN